MVVLIGFFVDSTDLTGTGSAWW